MKKFFVFLQFIFICNLLFSSCVSGKMPYLLSVENDFADENTLENQMFYFSFFNESEKNIKKFSVVLSLFDSDGEPVFASDSITISFDCNIPPSTQESFEIDLSQYFDTFFEGSYMTDYFYANYIEYDDGTTLIDEIGKWGL